jgi:hypothetical protein
MIDKRDDIAAANGIDPTIETKFERCECKGMSELEPSRPHDARPSRAHSSAD